MAGNSAKKINAENARTLRNLRVQLGIVNLVYILYRIFYHYESFTTRLAVAYSVTAAIVLFLYVQLRSMAGNPSTGAGGIDINGEGLVMYIYDVIYVTWFVHISSMFWEKMWYTYFVIPAYAFFKLYTMIIRPYLASRNGAGTNSGSTISEVDKKRKDKKEKQQTKVKYGRT